MARKRHDEEEKDAELDLAPIMNMVMILIPLLLLSTVFIETGVVNISSPRNAQSNTPETEEQDEETPVVVYISSDGFRVGDQTNLPAFQQFTQPISGCPGAGSAAAVPGQPVSPHDMADSQATICLADANGAALVDRLDFAALYNQLVAIRMQPDWFDRFGEENNSVISILGDPEVPFEVLIKTMDTARFFLQPGDAELVGPRGDASLIPRYQLNGGNSPTRANLEDAPYVKVEGELFELFPDPVLLLPRPNQGS
jgi:biopolymer transport protein ExbD